MIRYVISCCRLCELTATLGASMESSETEQTSRQMSRQTSQTLCITTRVADIRFTGVIASEEQCDSSDEDVVEALSFCSPRDSRKNCLCLF